MSILRPRWIWPAALIVVVALICLPEFVSHVQLIGNSDRLNTLLNIRFFDMQMIQSLGHIPLWNERMFMGSNATTPHYMIPIIHPLPWILWASGTQHPIKLMNVFAIIQWAAIGLVTFALVYDLARDRLIALTGAVLFMCGYQIYFRSFQGEDAALIYLALPAALLLVRHLARSPSILQYLLLFLCILVMMASFLQETSYALFVIGAYLVYLLLQGRALKLLGQIVLIIACAMVAGLPRV